MKGKPAVIFDCDGVMFDSRKSNIHFYNHLLAHFNLPPLHKDDVEYVHMQTAERSVSRIFRNSPFEEHAQAYRLKMDYRPFIRDMEMEPGLREVLSALQPCYRLAVATNRSTTIRDVLDAFGLADFFPMVVSSLDVRNPKPDPEALLKILDAFELEPFLAVYVGDSPVDQETALAAGMPFIAYRNDTLRTPYHAGHLIEIPQMVSRLITGEPNRR